MLAAVFADIDLFEIFFAGVTDAQPFAKRIELQAVRGSKPIAPDFRNGAVDHGEGVPLWQSVLPVF